MLDRVSNVAVAAALTGSAGVALATRVKACPIVDKPSYRSHTVCRGVDFYDDNEKSEGAGRGGDFSGLDLRFANFSSLPHAKTDLRHSSFRNANLKSADTTRRGGGQLRLYQRPTGNCEIHGG